MTKRNRDASSTVFKSVVSKSSGRADFTKMSSVKRVYKYLKPVDCAVLVSMLQEQKLLQPNHNGKPKTVLDVGGHDGQFLFMLKKQMAIRKILLSVNEPRINKKSPTEDSEQVGAYKKRILNSGGSVVLADDRVSTKKIEDPTYQLPKVDMVLASHMLYYLKNNRENIEWSHCSSVKNHLFTKLLRSLNKGGVLSIVLQSIRPTYIEGKHAMLASHEDVEDFSYVFSEKKAHGDNTNYTNAEEIDLAFNRYKKRYILEYGVSPDWNIQSKYAVSQIPLGDINFKLGKDGKYQQSKKTNNIFKFYLKEKDFNSLDAGRQLQWLNFVGQRCQTKEGKYVIMHVNRVFTVTVADDFFKHKKPDELEKSSPLSGPGLFHVENKKFGSVEAQPPSGHNTP